MRKIRRFRWIKPWGPEPSPCTVFPLLPCNSPCACVLVAVCTLSVQLGGAGLGAGLPQKPQAGDWPNCARRNCRMCWCSCRSATRARWRCASPQRPAAMDWPRDRLTIQLLDDGDSDGHAALAARRDGGDAGRREARDSAPRQPHRLQGRQSRLRPQALRRALCRDLRRRFRAAARFPAPHRARAGRRSRALPSCRRAGAMPTATPTG